MEEKESKKLKLKGRQNYLSWKKLHDGLGLVDDIIRERNSDEEPTEDEKGFQYVIAGNATEKKKNEKKARKLILESLDADVMHSIEATDSYYTMLQKLNAAYGFKHVEPATIKKKIRSINFHPQKNPAIVFDALARNQQELAAAGGSLPETEIIQYMHDALSGDHQRNTFWFILRGQMTTKGLSNYTLESAKKSIQLFGNNYRLPVQEHANRTSTTTTRPITRRRDRENWEPRHCDHCAQARPRIAETHNTVDCRYGPNINGQAANHVEPTSAGSDNSSNKEGKHYSSLTFIYDSGTSKTMVNQRPKDSRTARIPIYTAGRNQEPRMGSATGKTTIGTEQIDTIFSKDLENNLLSASQLSSKHGCEQIIEPWTSNLTIKKDGHVIATGKLDKTSNLIKVTVCDNQANTAVAPVLSDSWTTVHRKFGHISNRLIQNTVPKFEGITLQNKFEKLPCESCLGGKTKRSKVAKKSSGTAREVLEVVETDTQGPFAVVGYDNTTSNVKFIDVKSGWLHFETVPNTQAQTILDAFIRFQTRMERQTGKKIKRVRCDQGKEYLGEFLNHLELSGIIKEKGVSYAHHFPGKAERAHQTIMRMARAMLLESQLPIKYYTEAQKTAAYLFNRTVHSNDDKTPYEHIFGHKPDLSHLKPFVSVCYTFVPPEKRHKLENSGIKCRMIGYGDDSMLEEIKGYKLLTEDNQTVIWDNNVTFLNEFPEALHDSDPDEEVDDHNDLWYTPSESSDTDSDNPDSENSPSLLYDTESDFDEIAVTNLISKIQQYTWWQNDVVDQQSAMLAALIATTDGTPKTYQDAMNGPDKDKWLAAMQVEIDNIRKNKTYVIKKLPYGEGAIGCRWVFKRKLNADGTVAKYKARLVAKGYLQKFGKHYVETFAPVAKFKTIRLLLTIAASLGLKVYHDDVTTAFLNGELKETIFMDQPEGFQEGLISDKWLLLKSLYGLKQSPREWNNTCHSYLTSLGFTQSKCDPCLYFKRKGKDILIVAVYVDDIISTGTDDVEVQTFVNNSKANSNALRVVK